MSDHFSICEILRFKPENITLTSTSILARFNVNFGDFYFYSAQLHRRHSSGEYFIKMPGNSHSLTCRQGSPTHSIILDEAIKFHLNADPVPPRAPKGA